jgi:hypothetical protein
MLSNIPVYSTTAEESAVISEVAQNNIKKMSGWISMDLGSGLAIRISMA